MNEFNTPMPLLSRLLFRLALWLAPSAERAWVEEMMLEWAFLPQRARGGWAWGALGTALRFRLSATRPTWAAPRTFILSAATVATLIAVTIIAPSVNSPTARTDLAQEAQPAPQEALERDQNATASGLADRGSGSAERAAQTEQGVARARDAAPTAAPEASDAGQNSAAPPAPRLPSATVTETLLDSFSANSAFQELEALSDTAGAASMSAPESATRTLDEVTKVQRSNSLQLSPAAVVVLNGERVNVEVVQATRLELLELDTEPLARQVAAGERFSATLPFILRADDAGAVRLSIDGQALGPLGLPGLPLARKFVRP